MDRREFIGVVTASCLGSQLLSEEEVNHEVNYISENIACANVLKINYKNGNGRVYSDKVVDEIIENFERIKFIYGRLDDLNCPFTLKNVSHFVYDFSVENDFLVAHVKILDTEKGRILKKFKNEYVFRTCGEGKVENGKVHDYRLIAVDAVKKVQATSLC